MALDIHKLIAAIVPDVYCDVGDDFKLRDTVKKIIKEGLEKKDPMTYQKAAKEAKPLKMTDTLNGDKLYFNNPFALVGLKVPVEKRILEFDRPAGALEQIYFPLMDLSNIFFTNNKIDKIVDTFAASTGSGLFSETGMKATKMQDEASKMLGAANQVIKSILNIIYDLREFQMRLDTYKDYHSEDESKKNAAYLGLKQIWMDSVDIKRGTTSLKGLAQQFDYVTLIDAFMSAKDVTAVDKLDLNDRVKRILQQRMGDFITWIGRSENELKKRFEIEKIYLRSQVNTVRLYARWAKPYLKAAAALEQNAKNDASLVSMFNTTLMELVWLVEGRYEVEEDIKTGLIPKYYKDRLPKRKYKSFMVVEFNFRTIPERAQEGGYGHRGRATITFSIYALNDDEVKVLKEEIAKDEMNLAMTYLGGATDDSLGQIQGDIDYYLDGKEDKKEEKKEEKKEDSNPFSSLFSEVKTFFNISEKKEDSPDIKKGIGIRPDSDLEKVIRSQAILSSIRNMRKVCDTLKKVNGMPTLPGSYPE